MSKPVNEINKFIDYISNPTNIWDSKKYKQNDSELHISESGSSRSVTPTSWVPPT